MAAESGHWGRETRVGEGAQRPAESQRRHDSTVTLAGNITAIDQRPASQSIIRSAATFSFTPARFSCLAEFLHPDSGISTGRPVLFSVSPMAGFSKSHSWSKAHFRCIDQDLRTSRPPIEQCFPAGPAPARALPTQSLRFKIEGSVGSYLRPTESIQEECI